MIELLPSFIMPNDPAVARLLKATSDVLRTAGKNDALDGYKSKSRTRGFSVMEIVDQQYHVATDASGDDFIWLSETQRMDWRSFRLPATDADIRQIDAIPSEELQALVLSIDGDDPLPEMARALGIKRLTNLAKQRLESIL
ncbi:hypothetical protein ACU60T_24105 [Klebsiella aerogenes]